MTTPALPPPERIDELETQIEHCEEGYVIVEADGLLVGELRSLLAAAKRLVGVEAETIRLSDLQDAYYVGAKDGATYPAADDDSVRTAAEGYVKLWLRRHAPAPPTEEQR